MSGATMTLQGDPLFLPWQRDSDDTRFTTTLVVGLLVVLVVGGVVPLLPVPELDMAVPVRREQPLAQLVLPPRELPPPPVVERVPEPLPEPVPEPVPQPVPEPQPQPVPTARVAPEPVVAPAPAPEPVQTVRQAREQAMNAGVLAFRDQLQDLRSAVDTSSLRDTAGLQRGSGEAARVERKLLAADQGQRSAGVDVAALSRETGGVALAGQETTRVEAPVMDGPGGHAREVRPAGAAPARSIEAIRRVFDANKGAIYALYNRALRQQPGLAGKVVLELVISADGRVQDVQVVSADLPDAALVERLARRVRLFDFGAGAVAETTITYPLHFLPS